MKGLKELALGLGVVAVVGGLCAFATASAGAPGLATASAFTTSTSTHFVPAPGSSAAVAMAKRSEASLEAEHAFDDALARYTTGQASVEDVVTWSTKARDWSGSTTGYAEHRERMKKLEKAAAKKVASGSATAFDQHVAGHYRAIAEVMAP